MEDPSMEGCGLEGCRCHTLLNTTNPQGVFRDFPSLDTSDLNEQGFTQLSSRLQRQYEEVVWSFQNLIAQTLSVVKTEGVEPQTLVNFLEKIEATRQHSDVIVRRQPLFHQILDQLRTAPTTEQVFIDSHTYFSAFTYHVLTDILAAYGDKETNRFTVHRYVERFNYFNQRTIVKAPRIFSSPRKHGHAFLLFYLDWDPNKATVHELEAFRLNASFNLKMTHYPLMLIGVEMHGGEMIQMYQIPVSLKDLVFPFDVKQLIFFESKKVLKVECCGETVVTKVGRQFYSELKEREDQANDSETNFVTPPSSPPASRKATPPPTVIGSDPPYQLVPSEAKITDHHFELTKDAFLDRNYIAFVSNPSENSLLTAMVLCHHVTAKRGYRSYPKSIIIANTYRRALTLFDELKKYLPNTDIYCFTGAEESSITTKLCLDKTITIICTAGKLLSEFTADAVNFKMMTLLIIDGCEAIHHETSLEDLMQIYIRAKGDQSFKGRPPQIVGFTSQPNEGIFALTGEAMVDHLLSLCGLNDAIHGLLVTDKVRSEVFSKKEPRVSTEVQTIHYRNIKKDCLGVLSLEMGRIEHELDLVCLHERWSELYVTFMQEKKSAIQNETTPNLTKTSIFLDHLVIYSQAMAICKSDGPEQLAQFLRENRPRGDQSIVNNSLDHVLAEVDDIIRFGPPVETTVARFLSELFEENNEWRGVLFVDSEEESKRMFAEISSTVHHARPSLLSESYLTVISKHAKKRKDKEIVEGFLNEDSRLMIAPFALEEFDDMSLIDLPTCNFIIRFHKQFNELSRQTSEMLYIVTSASCQERKSCFDLCQSLQMSLLERAINEMPNMDDFLPRMVKQQKLSVREYVSRGYKIRRSLPPRKKKTTTKAPQIHQLQLRCKKCRAYACHGNQLYTLFIDGAKNYVVPYHEFKNRMTVKRFHPKRKVPKQISRLQKMYCSNCNSEWGLVCYFPKRGIEMPVLKSKYFIFEMKNQLYKIKMWSDALFYVPALSACKKYSGDHSDSD